MSISASPFPSPTFQLHGMYSRKLLLHTSMYSSIDEAMSPIPSKLDTEDNSLDTNIIMVLSVLLCALVCALGLSSMIKCALRCTDGATQNSTDGSTTWSANTGIKKKALKTFPTITYSADLKLPGLDTKCSICLSEFALGERLRVLPKCNHGFHVRCIDKWLGSHSSCPTCRHCLSNTCQKIIGCSQAEPSGQTPPLVQVIIVPSEPEGTVPAQRDICQ